jgi:outer membrane protein insertion porin family
LVTPGCSTPTPHCSSAEQTTRWCAIRDLAAAWAQLWLSYRLERVEASFPLQASHLRGTRREPILFDIIRGESLLSSLRAQLRVDTRDQPFLPRQGSLSIFSLETSLPQLGGDYDYQRVDARSIHYLRLPWHDHVLKLEGFGGAIAGSAPFFEQYFVGDLSDLLPSRALGVNFDRRPAPNFLGTDIVEVRYGQFAAKLDAEYRIPLYQGTRSVFGIDWFGGAGVYALASRREITSPPEGYSGAARIPVDLTFNLGFRMDTSIGGFAFAFSNILGFVPLRGEGPAGE